MKTLFGLMYWLILAAEGESPTFHGSEAFKDFRLAGHEMLDERTTDLNMDGLLDSIVVEKAAGGIGVSTWKAKEKGDYEMLSRSATLPGSAVKTFARLPWGGAGDFVVHLDVYEDSPDEADHFVNLFLIQPVGLKRILDASYRITHSEEDAGRTPTQQVDLGGLEVGCAFQDVPGGWPKVLLRHDPKSISLSGRLGKSVFYTIGIKEKVYAAKDGLYQEVEDRAIDYLPRLQPAEVTATTTLPSVENEWEPGNVTDGQLATGWMEGVSGPGEGQSITLPLKEPALIRLLRVVPGCAASADAWRQNNRLKRFTLVFEDGTSLAFHRELGAALDPGIEAWEDFPLPGVENGFQTLIVLSRPLRSKWIKLTIVETEPGKGLDNHTCISEISAHGALIDRKPVR